MFPLDAGGDIGLFRLSSPAEILLVGLLFPAALVVLLWPLGLTGIWLNFAGTALLAAVLAAAVLLRQRPDLGRPDSADPDEPENQTG